MARVTAFDRPTEVDYRHAEQATAPNNVVRHLSHELRQPLSTIDTAAYYLQLILSGADPRADQQLDKIQRMVHQMNWILSDAIQFLQAVPPRPAWIDLRELIAGHLAAEAIDGNVELDWTDSCSSPLVFLDPAQGQHLARTILNLFRLVVRADRSVYVSLYRDGAFAVLECSCEASERYLAHCAELLQPFTPYLPPGSGLALASVKRIAEVHRGDAFVDAVDGTLRLEVRLPAE